LTFVSRIVPQAERVRGLTARLARCRDALSTAGRADAAANTLSSLVESDFMQSFDARTLLCEAWIAAKKFDKATEVASCVLLLIDFTHQNQVCSWLVFYDAVI
jgi:hypothetical protein